MSSDAPLIPAAESALKWLRDHAPAPRDGHEALALAAHAVLLHYHFRSAAIAATDVAAAPSNATATANADSGPDTTAPSTGDETPSAIPSTTATTTTAAAAAADDIAGALPHGWGGAGFGGRYRHVRSAMTFDIRAVALGGRFMLHAVAGEDDGRLYTVDVRVDQYYTAPAAATTTAAADDGGGDAAHWTDGLRDMNGFATLVATQIAHRLVPDTGKAGYEHGSGVDTQSEQQQQQSTTPTPRPMPGPRPIPAYVDDPLRVPPRPHHPYPFPGGGRPVPPLGADDLLPAGLPLPGRGDARGDMFTGNLMGPNQFRRLDPRFDPYGGGGGGMRPPGVPPGARFDPYGAAPDRDAEVLPGFDDEHGVAQGGGARRGGPGGMGGRFGGDGRGLDDGPPPGMFF